MRSTLPTFNEVWQRQSRDCILADAEFYFPKHHFLIGCSGGMDSMLLLYLFSKLFPHRVRAIYIDHQLQSLSKGWGEFVAKFCHENSIPYISQSVVVQDGNLELQARNARYEAFQKHCQSHEILVLAHHQQDQAETLLLRLFSGAGISGLSAMKTIDRRLGLSIWRPLLNISKEQLHTWVKQENIPFVDDPTNFDEHYDRNWARATLWPVIQRRFPQMQTAVSRTTELMQDADEILKEIIKMDSASCISDNTLDLENFLVLSLARQKQLLSYWMKGDHGYRPSLDTVKRIQHEVINARPDAQASLFVSPFWYTRFQGKLYQLTEKEYLSSRFDIIASEDLIIDKNTVLKLLQGNFECTMQQKIGLSPDLLGKKLYLRAKINGEKIHLYGRVGHWPLKKAIQSAKIFPWLRHRVQILQFEDVILGVFTPQGFWLAQSKYCEKNGWQPKLVKNLKANC
ncbi:tRNA lysidine(34) synthetase TilS [Acinetobacter nectaris]|uniref:tRNA lysidine(34) synthetase TilS n=1 Tax=Acinetobacter nectaris TaxID=1219382 RepID=UPI001F01E1ED|nr:tRNA lysidine(34) synthetase TilS [Acinetobacter nectaris]MCF8999812.1 tRNA lysidine(34) synthetase TilS [Acinetobacter nectaris]MCF9026725.1 tRNA lysidine(34) synthetase TilS [Acinetobacter nectaris]